MRVFQLLLTCLFLASCATTSDVVKMGPDVYTLSTFAAPILGGESGARRMAIEDANKHCALLGKAIIVTNITTRPRVVVPGQEMNPAGSADITFRCLDKSDPAVQTAAPANLLPPQPMPGQPMPGQPAYGQPPYGQPMPGQPAYGQPMPGQMMPGQMMPGQPMPGQPAYGQPPYGQPMPGQPPYGQPMPGQPPYGQPMPGQPPYGQPMPGQPMPGQMMPGQPMPGQQTMGSWQGTPATGSPTAPPTVGLNAVVNWGNGKAYFFKGNQYIRFDIAADRADPGYPKRIDATTWPGVGEYFNTVDTVGNWGNGKAYFFKGNQYIRFDVAADRADPGYPKQINASTWPGVGEYFNTVDAVVYWGKGKAYFFKGNQYIRFDIFADRADPGYPKQINSSTWRGVGDHFSTVDTVVNWGNGKAYFIKGNQYISFDIATDQADPGYPQIYNF